MPRVGSQGPLASCGRQLTVHYRESTGLIRRPLTPEFKHFTPGSRLLPPALCPSPAVLDCALGPRSLLPIWLGQLAALLGALDTARSKLPAHKAQARASSACRTCALHRCALFAVVPQNVRPRARSWGNPWRQGRLYFLEPRLAPYSFHLRLGG